MRKHKNLIALLLIIISLCSVSLSAQALVLCVGADGHTALEAAVSGVCDGAQFAESWSAGPADHRAANVPTIEELHCGPCLDVFPSDQWRSPRSRQTETPASVPADIVQVAVVTLIQLQDQLQADKFTTTPTPRTPEPILHHRTTVLLI